MVRGVAAFVIACLVVQIIAQGSPGNVAINSITADGFDTIHLDTPSFLTTMQHSFSQHDVIVYGSGITRMVNDQNFQAMIAFSGAGWKDFPFVEVAYFNLTDGSTWAVGTLAAPFGNPVQPQGYELLVALVGGPVPMSPVVVSLGNHSSFIPTAIRVDARSEGPNTAIVYFVGYMGSSTPAGVSWGIIRTTITFTPSGSNGLAPSNVFAFDANNDVVTLNSLPFYIGQNDQNFVHHDSDQGLLFIVDNYIAGIYIISLPNTTATPMTNIDHKIHDVSAVTQGYTISSASYDPNYINMYLGLSVNGIGSGAISIENVKLPGYHHINTYPLPTNFSNPKAIVVDWFDSTLYVGMNGGAAILKYNLKTFELLGYQGLPEYLHRLSLGQLGDEHIYFATHEQHSKVFRVNKDDFCPKQCAGYGYCKAGKCLCSEFAEMLDGVCQFKSYVREVQIERRVHGGEVALGILFMFAVIGAAGGWFMYWRQRRGGASYQPVL